VVDSSRERLLAAAGFAGYEPKWLAKAERPALRADDGSAPVDAPKGATSAQADQ
jgi:hypothetical protein